MDILLIGHLGEAPPKKFFRWGTLGAPRLSYQSDRASILGVGTSKPSLLSARLLRTNPTFGISLPQHAAKASVLLGDYIWRSNRNMTDFAPQLHFLSCPGCPTPKLRVSGQGPLPLRKLGKEIQTPLEVFFSDKTGTENQTISHWWSRSARISWHGRFGGGSTKTDL
jgi:hypothetical protein